MVFSAAKSNNNNNNESWGMGLLFIFFHNHPHDHHHHQQLNKKPSFSLSSSSSSNLLLSKTQSTLSICALLVFATLLLFTLSSFEPTTNRNPTNSVNKSLSLSLPSSSRRFLHEQKQKRSGLSVSGLFGLTARSRPVSALQGMGVLYLRGSKSMSDLIVGHVSEDVNFKEFRSFLRLIVQSGLLSRSDLVFVYSSPLMAAKFAPFVSSECDSFLRLVQLGAQVGTELGHGLARYVKLVGEGDKGALWGKGSELGDSTRTGHVVSVNSSKGSDLGESTRPSYGSVVGFDSSELDPEDSLSGFLDHVPMSLRRWACYPMLLGRVRRNFKHMMLVEVKNSLILSDPFSKIWNRSSEAVFMWGNSGSDSTESVARHGKRKPSRARSLDSESRQHPVAVHPGVIIGGSHGVRRFANAALTEIVRVIIEHKGKGKNSVTESGLVNQLVHSGHLLKKLNLITGTDSIPETGSLGGFKSGDSGSGFLKLADYFSVVQRGSKFDVDYVIMREICLSHKLFTTVYSDCLAAQ